MPCQGVYIEWLHVQINLTKMKATFNAVSYVRELYTYTQAYEVRSVSVVRRVRFLIVELAHLGSNRHMCPHLQLINLLVVSDIPLDSEAHVVILSFSRYILVMSSKCALRSRVCMHMGECHWWRNHLASVGRIP